jgi:cell division protein FtsW
VSSATKPAVRRGAARGAAPAGDDAGPSGRILDRPLTSYHLVIGCTTFLLGLGLVMVLSASSVRAYAASGSSLSIFQKQLMWALIGLPLMWWVSRLPVRAFRAAAIPLLVGAVVLLLLVLVPGIGVSVNGNQNWIDFGGPFRLQPSEAAKLALVVWGADLLVRKHRLLTQWRHLLVPLLPVSGTVLLLVLLGGDLGTAIVLTAIVAALLFVVGAPARLFAILGAAGVAMVALLAVAAPYRLRRIEVWLHPETDYLSAGWQVAHAKFALGSGGWWGLGLGAGREKWGGLPEAHTDFIFAVIGEELGLIGTLAVLVLFGLLVYAGVRISLRSRDRFVRLAASATTAWLAVQALVNIGTVLGLLPVTGVPLPLVSYGGSALLPTLVGLGMLVAFARQEPGAAAALAARGHGPVRRLLSRRRSG